MPVGSFSRDSGFSELLHRLESRNLMANAEVARGRGIPAFAGMTEKSAEAVFTQPVSREWRGKDAYWNTF